MINETLRVRGMWRTREYEFKGRTISNRELELYVGNEHVELTESLRLANHSPTGFSVGYMGSGPAQAALGILLVAFRQIGAPNAGPRALDYYQDFKAEFLAGLDQEKDFEFELNFGDWLALKLDKSIRLAGRGDL